MSNISRILLFLLLLITLSCKGPGVLDCFESSGPYEEKQEDLPAFQKIVGYENIDLYLLNGSSQKVVVKAGKHLIPHIELTVNDGTLTIHNRNSCNWVRGPGNPGVYIYSDSLKRIETYGFINIYASDTFRIKSLELFTDGTGNFNLDVSGDSLFVDSEFISDFSMSGHVNYLSVRFTNDSQFHGKGLVSDDIFVTHKGSNTIEVYPVNSLTGTLESTGSLYYYNKPVKLDVKVSGTGKLGEKF